ncbi:MAG: hypothetical protein EKK45_12870, partial [Curvibacter sp.]
MAFNPDLGIAGEAVVLPMSEDVSDHDAIAVAFEVEPFRSRAQTFQLPEDVTVDEVKRFARKVARNCRALRPTASPAQFVQVMCTALVTAAKEELGMRGPYR